MDNVVLIFITLMASTVSIICIRYNIQKSKKSNSNTIGKYGIITILWNSAIKTK